MKNNKSFPILEGYFITVVALGLADCFSNVLGAVVENVKATIGLNTVKKQVEINKIAAEEGMEQQQSHVIGFEIPSDSEEYDDEEEYKHGKK